MKTTWWFLLVITLTLVSALPKKRGGGSSSRRGGGSGSTSGSSSSGTSTFGGGFSRPSGSSSIGAGGFTRPGGSSSSGTFGSGGRRPTSISTALSSPKYKKLPKASNFKKNVKKVALVAAGAYAGYKLAKLKPKFKTWRHRGGYDFDDWDDWREADGMLCRSNDDCTWVDQRMQCEDWEIRTTSYNPLWFGGSAIIAGECACPQGMRFNDNNMSCDFFYFGE